MKYRFLLLPQRINIAIMGFLALVVTYGMRACLAIAIVEMVHPANRSETNSSVCPVAVEINDTVVQVNSNQLNLVLVS